MEKIVSMQQIEAVEQIGICKLLDIIFPGYWDNTNFLKYSYEETCAGVVEWCNKNNAHYYARPKESYFPNIGVAEAIKLGKTKVVLEDLS